MPTWTLPTTDEQGLDDVTALMVGLVNNEAIWIPIFSSLITLLFAIVAIAIICCKCRTYRRFKCCAQALLGGLEEEV